MEIKFVGFIFSIICWLYLIRRSINSILVAPIRYILSAQQKVCNYNPVVLEDDVLLHQSV